MNLVCKTPCFTHGPIIPCVKSQHLLTTLAKMAFPYANRPFLHTANESRMQNPVFYSRQMNLVCKTPCFTHGPDQNSVPVCKNPTFTHGKLAPCVKRPILLTGWYNWFRLTQFCPRNRGFLWIKWSEMQFCPRKCRFLWTKRVVAVLECSDMSSLVLACHGFHPS